MQNSKFSSRNEGGAIRDRTLALEKYAQQARNIEAEKRAASIRIRAEMKGAELYRESEKAKGAAVKHKRERERGKVATRSPRDTALPPPKTLEQLGISKKQSSNWQKLGRTGNRQGGNI